MYSAPALRRLHLGVSIVVVTVTADASVEDDPLAADVRLLPAAALATTLPERMFVVTETATAITTARARARAAAGSRSRLFRVVRLCAYSRAHPSPPRPLPECPV